MAVSYEPAPDLPGDVPRSAVPDKEQNLLSDLLELVATLLEERGPNGAHGPAIHKPQLCLI